MKPDDVVTYNLSDFTEFKEESYNTVKKAPTRKPIREYTLEGEFIRLWNNVSQVATAFNTAYNVIRGCIRGRRLSAKGRIFLSGTDKIEDRLALIQEENRRQELIRSAEEEYSRVCQIKVYTSSGEFLRTCSSVSKASGIYNLSKSSIQNQLSSRKSLVTKGLCFLRNEETIEERLRKIRSRKTHKKNL